MKINKSQQLKMVEEKSMQRSVSVRVGTSFAVYFMTGSRRPATSNGTVVYIIEVHGSRKQYEASAVRRSKEPTSQLHLSLPMIVGCPSRSLSRLVHLRDLYTSINLRRLPQFWYDNLHANQYQNAYNSFFFYFIKQLSICFFLLFDGEFN